MRNICRLDEQQCRDSCEHHRSVNCPFVTTKYDFTNTVIEKITDFTIDVPYVKERIEKGDFVRAGGECECECGKQYIRHKNVEGYEWLTVLCDGTLVKL